MNFLVVSRISIPAKDRTLPAWNYLRDLGHRVVVEHPESPEIRSRPDVLISMGVTIMEETFAALKRFGDVPLYCYNWDCYEWVWSRPRPGEYDYKRYGELLKQAREVWVPSYCTGERTTQWWGIKNWNVILSACPYWDHPNVHDGGYALCTLREIPDPWWGKFEECCARLNIPYKMSLHEKTYQEYQDLVAGCRFLCAPLYELSTGGLTLMEGYYLGKPCLVSDSRWNGARDYLGDRANYFKHGDVHDFEDALIRMHDNPPPVLADHQFHIKHKFSDQRMVDDMLARIRGTM